MVLTVGSSTAINTVENITMHNPVVNIPIGPDARNSHHRHRTAISVIIISTILLRMERTELRAVSVSRMVESLSFVK